MYDILKKPRLGGAVKPLLWVMCLFCVVACGNPDSQKQAQAAREPASREVRPVDPAKQFEQFVAEATQQTSSQRYVRGSANSKAKVKWISNTYRISGVRYDVLKTDSLVNPIVGTVQFVLETSLATHLTKEEADAAQPAKKTIDLVVRLRFVYRDGTWQLHSGTNALASLIGLSGKYWYPINLDAIQPDPLKGVVEPALVPWLRSQTMPVTTPA